MAKQKITIYDVADRAHVAISTVSRVLNNSHEVSDATREKVLLAIDELNFRPDRTAKTLAQKKTHAIAVAVPSFTSQFYVEVLKGIKDRLRDNDIDLLLCNLGSNDPVTTLWRFLSRGAVDALMLLSLPMTAEVEKELKRLHAPVVLIGSKSKHFDCFYWDDFAGAKSAVAHLIAKGHKNIGMIAAHAWSFNADARVEGYKAALADASLPFDQNLIVEGKTNKHAGFSEEAGFEAMKKLIANKESNVTAVFASSDVQAIGAWKALRESGRIVPQQVALVGYDNIKLSRYIELSTVDQKMQEVGFEATALLLDKMDTPAGVERKRNTINLRPQLVEEPQDYLSKKITPLFIPRQSSNFVIK